MSTEQIIHQKMARLQTLRQYQTYYGPHTPYPVILEINQLETELGQLLRTGNLVKKNKPKKNNKNIGRISQATVDLLATISFIGFTFVLGIILVLVYLHHMNQEAIATIDVFEQSQPVLRPTFTPTVNPSNPLPEQLIGDAPIIYDSSPADSFLPTPAQATDIPTPVPTITPKITNTPTSMPIPTDIPSPTRFPPTPIPVRIEQPNTPTPAPPPPTTAPSYAFRVTEQGNREFQKTNYHAVTVYVAVVSEGNIPVGGYKVVGDHVPSGKHVESPLSTWDWSVINCLDCNYIKQGNLKFEPGPIIDGSWNIYLAAPDGQQLSPVITLSYSSDPEQWVWDFVIFQRE
jgi:hypothetical protein